MDSQNRLADDSDGSDESILYRKQDDLRDLALSTDKQQILQVIRDESSMHA